MDDIKREDLIAMFEKYYVWKKEIEKINEKLFWLEAKATKVTPSYDPNKGGEPVNNPKDSKIEAAAVEADELLKLRAEYQHFVDIADAYLNKLRYNQQYLIKCVVCNKMPPEEFGRKWHIAKRTVQQNRDRWLDKMLE